MIWLSWKRPGRLPSPYSLCRFPCGSRSVPLGGLCSRARVCVLYHSRYSFRKVHLRTFPSTYFVLIYPSTTVLLCTSNHAVTRLHRPLHSCRRPATSRSLSTHSQTACVRARAHIWSVFSPLGNPISWYRTTDLPPSTPSLSHPVRPTRSARTDSTQEPDIIGEHTYPLPSRVPPGSPQPGADDQVPTVLRA